MITGLTGGSAAALTAIQSQLQDGSCLLTGGAPTALTGGAPAALTGGAPTALIGGTSAALASGKPVALAAGTKAVALSSAPTALTTGSSGGSLVYGSGAAVGTTTVAGTLLGIGLTWLIAYLTYKGVKKYLG